MDKKTEIWVMNPGRQQYALLVATFVLSIFLSATLLFSVQPMFTKLTLPLLGGASNVWNTAMVFFQGTLLAGYIYAHLISKHLSFKWQIGVHTIVMAIGAVFLPLAIASGWTPPAEGAHAFWLIALFAVSIGVPFFAISANAPLLQRWFSYTSHSDAQDPYFLYATSNAGSLLSLCLYPVVFEPMMRLREQTGLWSYGYFILIGLLILAGLVALRRLSAHDVETSDIVDITAVDHPKKRWHWIGLAFIPSSLMLGITSHMTNNIASAPLLWIVPLSLYLLTFVIVFARNPIVTTKQLRPFFPIVTIIAILSGFILKSWIFVSIVLSLICYFIIALMCHSRLVDERPSPKYLTEFFICMSIGGVLGGIFNALIAPIIFNGIYEYLIVLLLVGLAVPHDTKEKQRRSKVFAFMAMCLVAAYIAYVHFSALGADSRIAAFLAGAIVSIGLFIVQRNIPKSLINSFAIFVIIILALPLLTVSTNFQAIYQDRSFFGVIRVKSIETENGVLHNFEHGDTVHNFQLQDEKFRKIPLAYYGRGNAIHTALSLARRRNANIDVAIIGLGAGAMACFEKQDDKWVYFEIDPAVVKMAQDPNLFSFMSECSFEQDIRIGDARQTIVKLPPQSQDLIVIDAFNSDSIPAHLLTREALALYREKLKSDGFIFFHTSNRYMDVASVVVRLAEDAGLESRYIFKSEFPEIELREYYKPSEGVLVGKKEVLESAVENVAHWQKLEASDHVKLWTDDYSHIIGTIISKREKKKQSKSQAKK